MIKLMYITNEPEIAKIAENNGVDRIFIDLEIKGKEERQGNLDTVISKHNINDVEKIKKTLKKAELLVRVNPINENSKNEIDSVIEQGADIVMLPFFKTEEEVQTFIKIIDKRVKVCLLCETPEAVACIDNILKKDGIDEIHIGLNDLHLGYKKKFMFELLTDGTVEKLCNKFSKAGIKFGFGGIARIGMGTLPAEHIITEHYRLGSSMAILSRSFCNTKMVTDLKEIEVIFKKGIEDIRNFEEELIFKDDGEFEKNKKRIEKAVEQIVNKIKNEEE